ncbi:MAG: hypothetical protein GY799_21230 [Desulfobulbaceae bacterium]|nr:hypothetical protein [Desulfobulbaceae bacterium]
MTNYDEEYLEIDLNDFESYEEKRVYECYSCNWVGEDPHFQKSDIFESDEESALCPICGQLL